MDFSIYTILGNILDNVFFINMLSSVIGVTYVYIFSTKKLFCNRIHLKRRYVAYFTYQCVLIFCVSNTISMLNNVLVAQLTLETLREYSASIAKVIVSPVTFVMNFCVMKGIIQRI